MLRLLTPIILVCIAAATFFVYTDPHYQNIKTLRAQEREYDDALTKSKDLKEQRNKLISKVNLLSPDDTRKLERLLPNSVDNIRLIIDIDNIAGRYGQHIRSVAVSTPTDARDQASALAVGASPDKVGSVELSFTTTAKYEDFVRFIQDLERSIRIVDIESITFSAADSSMMTFAVRAKTYWLR